jgi:hypothetical protein
MRIPSSLNEVQFRFYALRYGDDEARKIMLLHSKDRVKHIAMLDEHGPEASKIESQRHLGPLFETAINALAEASPARSWLYASEHRLKSLRDSLEHVTESQEIEAIRAEIAGLTSKIVKHRPLVDNYTRKIEESSKAYEDALAEYENEFGAFHLPERKKSDQTQDINHDPRIITEDRIAAIFAAIFGVGTATEILLLQGDERWQRAFELIPAAAARATKETMMFIREPAVSLITQKTRIQIWRDDYATRIEALQALEPTEENLKNIEKHRGLVNRLDQARDHAIESVEVIKRLVIRCEASVKQKANIMKGVDPNADASKST